VVSLTGGSAGSGSSAATTLRGPVGRGLGSVFGGSDFGGSVSAIGSELAIGVSLAGVVPPPEVSLGVGCGSSEVGVDPDGSSAGSTVLLTTSCRVGAGDDSCGGGSLVGDESASSASFTGLVSPSKVSVLVELGFVVSCVAV
jgi:hypothetical protein